MKIILSRKGFDSSYGGCPSPILPDGTMVSLPIPHKIGIPYTKVSITPEISLKDIMGDLCPEPVMSGKRGSLDMFCHLDPDINHFSVPRDYDWRPIFGQNNAAAGHLLNKKVGEGDIFLFFGWFQKTRYMTDGRLEFYGDSFHALFAYFEIDSVHHSPDLFSSSIPNFALSHPHMQSEFENSKNNMLFISSEHLSLDKTKKGAAIFKWDEQLKLSVPGMSRSFWDLPSPFRNTDISYHTEDSWKDGLFRARSRGQEFVVEVDTDLQNWLTAFIKDRDVFGSL